MRVAFYKGRTRIFNRVVLWFLRGPYSHCELVLDTRPNGASVCASSSFMDGGVRIKHIDLHPDRWDLVEVPDTPTAWDWLRAREEEKYDLLGLFGFVWRRQTGEQNKWFCSEACAAMLGFPDPWRFDPMTLKCALAWRLAMKGATRG